MRFPYNLLKLLIQVTQLRIPTISFFSRGLAPSELRVVCGDWDIKQKIETRADQERKVREVTGKFRQEPTTKVKRS